MRDLIGEIMINYKYGYYENQVDISFKYIVNAITPIDTYNKRYEINKFITFARLFGATPKNLKSKNAAYITLDRMKLLGINY